MRLETSQQYLDAMVSIEAISATLDTRAFIWGGWTPDIYRGQPLRAHTDIDCFVIDLYRHFGPFGERLLSDGWEVKDMLEHHLLWAKRDAVKLHLGHIELGDGIVCWKHNGDDGCILFPTEWLCTAPVPFMGGQVYVVRPELGYVLKTDPSLMNPEWTARDKDRADIEVLEALLRKEGVELEALPPQVSAVDGAPTPAALADAAHRNGCIGSKHRTQGGSE